MKLDTVAQMKLLRKEHSTAFEAVLTKVKAALPRHRKGDGDRGDGTEDSVDPDIADDASAAVSFEVSAVDAATAV